ncbi:hypothetical protein ACPCI0_24400 [Streptomyces griseoincarnatus]
MSDLKNIALTVEAAQSAEEIQEWIGTSRGRGGSAPDKMDRIRLGFAYAIVHDVSLSREGIGRRGGSNYDVGGLDPDGLMAETVKIYYRDKDQSVLEEPYRAVEVLMNKGLLLLSEHRAQGGFTSMGDLLSAE